MDVGSNYAKMRYSTPYVHEGERFTVLVLVAFDPHPFVHLHEERANKSLLKVLSDFSPRKVVDQNQNLDSYQPFGRWSALVDIYVNVFTSTAQLTLTQPLSSCM